MWCRYVRTAGVEPQCVLQNGMLCVLQDGARTMPEIMGRMRDQAQLRLQNLERDYCSTLNALAACCLLPDDKGSLMEAGRSGAEEAIEAAAAAGRGSSEGSGRRPAAAVRFVMVTGGRGRVSDAGGGGSPSSSSGGDTTPPTTTPTAPPVGRAVLLEALALLEASHRVGEYGIDAEASGTGSSSVRELEAGPQHDSQQQQHEDISAKDASIRAWRFVQV